jgi:hypothetical protein
MQQSSTQNYLIQLFALDRNTVWVAKKNGTILASGTGGR